MKVRKIHHVALRCANARATADFYREVLGMELLGAVSDDLVPSTKEADTYVSVLLDAGDGSILAFFELADWPPATPDASSPRWVQHIAFEVESLAALDEAKVRAQAAGVEVVGPVDHTIFHSIYLFDPDGHRVEVAVATQTDAHMGRLKASADEVLAQWALTKRPPQVAAWVHQKEFAQHAAASPAPMAPGRAGDAR